MASSPVWCASAMAGLLLVTQGFAAAWTPAQLGSGTAKNWYDADAASTLWQDAGGTTPVTDNGQTVLRWNDRSGNGNHLTSLNGPVFTTGVMNAHPVLTFADDSFINSAPSMGNITDNFTVIGVFNVTGNNFYDNWIRWGNGGAGDPDVFVVGGARAGGPAQGMEFSYDAGEGETTDAAVTGQPAFMFIGALDQVPDPDLFAVWKDGVSHGSRNPTPAYRTTPSASLSQFRIGPAENHIYNPNGDIAELLVLNTGTGNLSQADREKLEGYLAHKWWGADAANPLPAEHPYKTTPPQGPAIPLSISSQPEDVFVRVNQSATFSVAANGSEPLSYQWYAQGSPIDGATSFIYSINLVAAFDAGGYSVVVADSVGGSVTSRVATLMIVPFGGATLGVNFSTDCPPSASIDAIQLSEVADGYQGWENIPIRTCAGQNLVPGTTTVDGGVVTVSWAANAVWFDGSTATPSEKLFRIYLDDAEAGNVTVSGLSAWLAQLTATNSALNAFKVRLYWNANTGSSLAPMEIRDGSDTGPVLDTVRPFLPGYGTGVQRAMGDSAPMNSDTIAITWPARPADLTVRASLAALKITASSSLEQPEILSQPQSVTLYQWSQTALSVAAIGSAPLAYQWRHYATNIGGATSPTLPLANLQATDAGEYRVVVSNPAGAVTSQVATVSFRVPAPDSYEAAVAALQPLGYWLLDETTGTNALDYVNGANGVYQNGPLLGQPGATTSTGTSVRLNGVNQSVDVRSTDSLNVGAGDFTVVAWIFPTAYQFSGVVGKGGYSWAQGWLFDFNAVGQGSLRLETSVGTSGGQGTVQTDSGAAILSNWQHVAVSCQRDPGATGGQNTTGNGLTKIYINGVVVKSGDIGPGDLTTALPLTIGRIGGVRFPGGMDDVAFFGQALSGEQIAGLYRAGVGDIPPTIIGQPADLQVNPSASATFTVQAFGVPPLAYQWYFEGSSIDGATSDSYAINLVAEFDAGGYRVVVANPFGSVTSRVATLTIQQNYTAVWTPAELGSDTLKNWYDANAANTIWRDVDGTIPVTANSQTVLRWDDQSGNGNHLTTANGPVYTTGVMNAHPVLTFADDSFINSAPSMGNITDNFTVIGVFNVTGNNSWDNWIKWGDNTGGAPDVFVVSGGRAGGPAQGMEFSYDGGEGETTDTAVRGQPAFLFIGALDQLPDPDLFSVWKDGLFQGSRNPTAAYRTTPSASLAQFRIGLADNNTSNPNGDIAELLVLNTGTGNLSPADREKLEGYMAHKWWGAGAANPLPADHPYKTTVPGLRLEITRSAEGIKITWPSGTLQSATTLGSGRTPANWVDLTTATSPYPVDPTNAATYYRLRQ